MQCTSYKPVYYHARDLNVDSWHLYDSNATSYGEERGYSNVSMPSCDQYLGYDKEVLKQIIQNHEATFRYQVQELHRLYRRQRDLMDEMRVREIFAQHLLSRTAESIHSSSHAGDEISQKPSPATGWLLGNLSSCKLSELTSGYAQVPKSFIAEIFQKPSTLQTEPLLLPSTKQNRIFDLELPAHMYHDDRGKHFKAGNLSEAPELTCRTPEKISDFQAATHSDIGSTKTWDLSSSGSDIRKTYCFIDLNEPIQLESLPTSSSSPLKAFTSHSETVCSNECVLVKATPESKVPIRSQLVKSGENSNGTNSSMDIDLNSMPDNCFSEREMTFESPPSINREAKLVVNRSSDISDSFLKTESYIDLNAAGVVDEHPLPPPSSTLEKKSAEYTELKGPVSPENEERSPPRGESEDIQLETPLSSEQGEGEPFIELDTTAAQTLVMIFSSGVEEGAAVLEPVANFRNLCWFAEIVSSTGDELENEVMNLEADATAENDQGEENAPNSSCFYKGKGTGNMSRRSGKGQKRGKKQRKGFKTEALGFLERGPLKRKPGRSACAKPRKHSKISPSDVTKKSMSSILKQSAASSDQGVVQSWGRTRKREGGRRHRASQFFLIS